MYCLWGYKRNTMLKAEGMKKILIRYLDLSMVDKKRSKTVNQAAHPKSHGAFESKLVRPVYSQVTRIG